MVGLQLRFNTMPEIGEENRGRPPCIWLPSRTEWPGKHQPSLLVLKNKFWKQCNSVQKEVKRWIFHRNFIIINLLGCYNCHGQECMRTSYALLPTCMANSEWYQCVLLRRPVLWPLILRGKVYIFFTGEKFFIYLFIYLMDSPTGTKPWSSTPTKREINK